MSNKINIVTRIAIWHAINKERKDVNKIMNATYDATDNVTKHATWDATGAATWIVTRNATSNATWSVTRGAIEQELKDVR